MASPPVTETTVENHPIFHDWYRCSDFVTQRNSRNRIIEIRRIEYCSSCSTTKKTYIDVATWRPNRSPSYSYLKGEKIVRVSKASFNRKKFLDTTDLSDEDKEQLAALKLRELEKS